MNNLKKIFYLLINGVYLFFILAISFFSSKVFNYYWNKYYNRPLEKNIFNLCVQWLLYIGDKVGLDYYEINVLIFCIIWPIITIISIIFNIILLVI